MRLIHILRLRLRGLIHRSKVEEQPQKELRFHLERARPAALRRAGKVGLTEEHRGDFRRARWLEAIARDICFALRGLQRNPGFAALAILMLALGIGVNGAVFTVTNAILFKGFRLIDRNDRILYVHSEKNGRYSGVSYPDLQDWRAQSKSFAGMGAVAFQRVTLNDGNGFPETYSATRITANGFKVLGTQPIIGRDFTASDEIPGAAPVAILSFGFWQQRYGRDRAIIRRSLQIDGVPTTVIGVMSEGFSFPQSQDLWMPLVPTPDLQPRDARNLWFAFGRLAEGATKQSARVELETIGNRLASAYPRTNKGQTPAPHTFTEFFIGANSTVIYGALWSAVGFVLLIACANLANLLLARGIARSRGIALRMAVGASHWSIKQQLVVESLTLSGIGGLFGLLIARWGVQAYELSTNPPVGEWRHNLLDYGMDYRVIAYLMAISIGAGFIFGLAPALRFSPLDISTLLKNGSRGSSGGARSRHLSSLLVTAQVALAIVLLAGAGLMIRSFLNLYTADLGFRANPANVLALFLNLPEAKYSRPEAQSSFFDSLKTRFETLPGVKSASIGGAPAGGTPALRPYQLAGDEPADAERRPTVSSIIIGPDYFRTLQATVVSGREFNDFDGPSGIPAVVVNQRFASRHWPREDPIGKRLRLFNGKNAEPWMTVIGVVDDVVQDRFRQIEPLVYTPYGQRTSSLPGMWILVRTAVPPAEVAGLLRREIMAMDPELPIWLGPYTLDDALAQTSPYGSIRNHTVLLLVFAAIALVLASMGVYAAVAHQVSQRTQEIGVRIAIGATAEKVFGLIFRLGMFPVGIGLIVGVAASLAVNRVLASELVQVLPADPLTLVVAAAVLIITAALGCLIPARRAMRVDPIAALKDE